MQMYVGFQIKIANIQLVHGIAKHVFRKTRA